jgi:putative flippase GtrA
VSDLGRQSWRFLLVGGANTAITAALLAVLAQVIDPAIAYTIVFALGLTFTTFATSRYVFSADASRQRLALFVAWYLGVYAVGLVLVHVLDRSLHWTALPLAIVTVMVTAPLSFLGGRMIFHGDASRQTLVRRQGG